MDHIIIATKNTGKVKEFKSILAPLNIEVTSLLDFSPPLKDIEETGKTFEDNARLKAETIGKLTDQPVIADDSGLIIDALNGRPGIYSARFAGEHATDEDNMRKVLTELLNVPYEARTARFICVLAFALPTGETTFHKGYCEGKIAFEPKGDHGFGYDPIFIPEGFQKTFAQLPAHEKNQLSHRHDAIQQLKGYLIEEIL